MAEVFTDTPKIGVAIGVTIPLEDMNRSGHRDGSKVFASDGKTYQFTVAEDGSGSWEEVAEGGD